MDREVRYEGQVAPKDRHNWVELLREDDPPGTGLTDEEIDQFVDNQIELSVQRAIRDGKDFDQWIAETFPNADSQNRTALRNLKNWYEDNQRQAMSSN